MSENYLLFHEPTKFDGGTDSKAAIDNNGNIVEVHQSEGFTTLWFHVGRLKNESINWSVSKKYDSGITPNVAMNNNGRIVEVHRSEGVQTLWYHTGTLKGDTVDWSKSSKYDKGCTPSVALSDNNKVIEVHQSDGPSTNLWYNVGELKDTSITWLSNKKYDTGETPSVAINKNNTLVEVHQSDGPSIDLWYHIGTLEGNNISWGSSRRITNETGYHPTVTLSDDNEVVVTYSNFAGELARITGVINSNKSAVNWDRVIRFGTGHTPGVAGNSKGDRYIHTSNMTSISLGVSIGYQEVNNSLEKEMWKYSMLAHKIKEDGSINSDLIEQNGCKQLYGFAAGGKNKIHRGYIAEGFVGSEESVLILAFRGTDGVDDWMNDFNIILKNYDYGQGKVHQGFMNGTKELVEQGILSDPKVVEMIKEFKEAGNKKIYITGHSKGAALATLIANKVKSRLNELDFSDPDILLLTYGSPKVGDSTFKKYFEHRYYRYESDCDGVPLLPPIDLLYVHTGIQVKFAGKYPLSPLGDAHNKDYPEFIKY